MNGIYLATATIDNSSGLGKVIYNLSNWAIVLVAAIFLVRIFLKVFKLIKGDSPVKIGDILKDVLFALIIIFIITALQAFIFNGGLLQNLLNTIGGKANTLIESGASNILN